MSREQFSELLSTAMSEAVGRPIKLVFSPLLYDPMTFEPRFAIMEEIDEGLGHRYKKFKTLGRAAPVMEMSEQYLPILLADLLTEYNNPENNTQNA